MDYSFKPSVDLASIAALYQKKPVLEQEMQQRQSQMQDEAVNRITNITKMATDLTQNMMTYNQQNQTKQLMDTYAQLASQPIPQPKIAETKDFGAVPTMAPTQITPTGDMQALTPDQLQGQRQSLAFKLATRLNPEAVGKQLATGLGTPKLTFQEKQGTLDGKPIKYVIDPHEAVPRDLTPQHAPIQGTIEPIQASSPIAEVRKEQLISTLNTKAATAFDPAKWKQSSTAGKSAQIVANAQSAINLGKQMQNKEIPITPQNFGVLSADVNRVISQSGQTSEQSRKELITRTGYSKMADAVTFFTNHPEDQKTGAFIDILMKEMGRQRDMRQNIVNQTLSRNLPELEQLKRISPQDWENHIKANGLDLEAAKKGKLVFTKDGINSLTGENLEQAGGSAGGLQIDQNALQAELKRRGL